MRLGDEIPGMNGLCWSDLPLSEEEIYDLRMSGAFDELGEHDPAVPAESPEESN